MFPVIIENLGKEVHLIDVYDGGRPGKTGVYVLGGEQAALVDTGAAPAVPYILEGLRELGIGPEEIRYVILTHIHLDHAGAAGLLAEHFPGARFLVHPKGQRHLIDPSRLVEGAKQVYGDAFGRLFDPVVPIPGERVISVRENETLELGGSRTLRFLDTPGHAYHHISIYDSLSNGIFTGDTIGLRYPSANGEDSAFYLPVTSPTQFDPDAMMDSLRKIRDCRPDKLFFGHYGMSGNPEAAYRSLMHWLPVYVREAERAHAEGEDAEGLRKRLFGLIERQLPGRGNAGTEETRQAVLSDLKLSAAGLLDRLNKQL